MTTSRKFDDLLVFGYSCKLFRDDERALEIDHLLIPWMGDRNHRIDRYDGRGAISDLKQFEPPEPNGYNQREFLDKDDLATEEMCDRERYKALNEHDVDHVAEEEEIEKRSRGNEFAFDYNSQPVPEQSQHQQAQEPVEPEQPSLRTLANCIEKTAEFITKQGVQMEILMRAKEANNPKFQFLNPDNPYHSIYKQVLEKKRSRPKNYVANASMLREASLEVEQSLKILAANLPSAAPAVSSGGNSETTTKSTSYSTNSYSQLVQRIRESQPATPPPPAAVQDEEQKSEVVPKPENPDPKLLNVVEVAPPPIAKQPLIDKTASYVAKNGSSRLSVLKKHEPEKFSFLFEGDKYNLFFQYKVQLYKEMLSEKREQEYARRLDINGGKTDPKTFPVLKGFFR